MTVKSRNAVHVNPSKPEPLGGVAAVFVFVPIATLVLTLATLTMLSLKVPAVDELFTAGTLVSQALTTLMAAAAFAVAAVLSVLSYVVTNWVYQMVTAHS